MITALLLIYLVIGFSLTIWSREGKTVHLMDFFYILFWPFWVLGACIVLLLAVLNAKWGSYDL